jgi:nucleotide-binding universal stress UspA family protein
MTTSEGERGAIVVGVDGSPTSMHALRWAIRQGELTGAVVDAVTAWEHPVTVAAGYGWAPAVPLDEIDYGVDYAAIAAERLAKCVSEALAPGSPVVVRQHVAQGGAGQVLVDLSRDADLLVVGSRGHSEFTEALIGSVSQRCVHHASCPVVVIRERREDR